MGVGWKLLYNPAGCGVAHSLLTRLFPFLRPPQVGANRTERGWGWARGIQIRRGDLVWGRRTSWGTDFILEWDVRYK